MPHTYVVSPTGNDAFEGSLHHPWRPLAHALPHLTPGDTLLVRAGTYHEKLVPQHSGKAGAPVVIKAFPGEHVTLDGAPDNDLNVVYVGKDHVIIEGFTVCNAEYLSMPGKRTYWVELWGTHIQFRHNRLIVHGDPFDNIYQRQATSRGIVVAGQHNVIEHCFVRGVDIGIIVVGSAPRFTVLRYDTIYATGSNNLDIGATDDGTTAYHGTLVEYCVLDTSITEDNIQFEPDYNDPKTTLHNRGTIIRHNRLGHAAENCIDLKGAGHTIIDHNLLYSAQGDDDGPIGGRDSGSGAGIEATPNNPTRTTIVRYNIIWDNCSGVTLAENDHYYNNTILNNRRTWQGPNQPGGEFVGVNAWNYERFHRAMLNTVVAGQPNRATLGWRMEGGGKFTVDYNLYYEKSGPVKFYHMERGKMVTTVGLRNWQRELQAFPGYAYLGGKDSHTVEADPGFVKVPPYPADYDSSWDFRLRPGSPARGSGRPVTWATGGGERSTTIVVDDAYFFCDGFGVTEGDRLKIDGAAVVGIRAIDYEKNTIHLTSERTWKRGAGVHLDYEGKAPNIGAM